MVLNRSKNNKCRIFKKMIQLQTTVNEKKTQMDEDRLQVWSSGDEKWYNLGECTIYMYPLPHFNNLLSSGHIYRVNFLGFITDLGRMNIGYKIKKFKIKFSWKIIKKKFGFLSVPSSGLVLCTIIVVVIRAIHWSVSEYNYPGTLTSSLRCISLQQRLYYYYYY